MYKQLLISALSFIVCGCMLIFCGCGSERMIEVDNGAVEQITDEEEEPVSVSNADAEEYIYVHITGAVKTPGLFELPKGSRLYDAVEMAGGFASEADTEYANLAEILEDGKQYNIYSRKEVNMIKESEAALSGSNHFSADGKLNINLATVEELMELDCIGKSKAEKIFRYREENGSFSDIEEIKNVSGIGEGIYSGICDSICVF